MKYFNDPEYNSLKVVLLIVVIFFATVFIIKNAVQKNRGNEAQIIYLDGPIDDGAVLPSLLASGIDLSFNGLFDTKNSDFHQILGDLGLNMLRYNTGTTANYSHYDGPGFGLKADEMAIFDSDGTQATELGYTATYTLPFVSFFDQFIDAVQNLPNRQVATYSMNVMTIHPPLTLPVTPVKNDTATINATIDENIAALTKLVNSSGVVVEGVQFCAECKEGKYENAFPTPQSFVDHVLPVAQAVHDAFDKINIQLHVGVPHPTQVEYGLKNDWNDALFATDKPSFADLPHSIVEIGTYFNLDDIEDTDINCDNATLDPFICFKGYARKMLDTDMQSVMDAYTNHFGLDRGYRFTQWNINNYDGSINNPNTFTTSFAANTISQALYVGEFLFKLADYNANPAHPNIIRSATFNSFSGPLDNLVSVRKKVTDDNYIPTTEFYGTSYYTKQPLKLNASGLVFKLINKVFSGHQKVVPLVPTIPTTVPTGDLQIYAFKDIPTNKNSYYFFNWSSTDVPLETISFDGVSVQDASATLSTVGIFAPTLSAAYGAKDSRNKTPFGGVITDTLYTGPVSSTGTASVTIPKYSIVKIDGLDPSKFAGNIPNRGNTQFIKLPKGIPFFGDKVPPPIPTGLNRGPVTSNSIVLFWDPVVDDSGKPVTYNLNQSNLDGSNEHNIGSTTNTTLTAIGLNPGTTYLFKVQAVDTSNNFSLFSPPVQFHTGN